MTGHMIFIATAYGLTAAGLILLAAKSYVDMKRLGREADNLRRLRRGKRQTDG